MNTATATPEPIVFSQEEARYRHIEDSVISPEECARLINLIETHGAVGDGYGGKANPHSPHETFGGYSLGPVGGERDDPDHQLCVEVMNRVRLKIKKHFKLPFLWLDYGHLVFREATPVDETAQEEDFSHPWHYDNNAEHVKYRTHTAILYINDGFEGGYTRFKEMDFGPYREVKPKPGTMVAFDATMNPHGVSKLKSGKRYVLNMWFSTHLKVIKNHYRIFGHL